MKGYHPLLWLGPVVVLGPADCDLRKPSSIRSKRVVCFYICFLNLIWLLKIFFMSFHIEDMKALESVGGDFCQKADSSSSSNSSSEEDSARVIEVLPAHKNIAFQNLENRVQVLNTTAVASGYAGRDPQGGTSDGSFFSKFSFKLQTMVKDLL